MASFRAWCVSSACADVKYYRNIVRLITELSKEHTCQFNIHKIVVTRNTNVHRINCTIHPSLFFVVVGVHFINSNPLLSSSILYTFAAGPYKKCWKPIGMEIHTQYLGNVFFHPNLPIMAVIVEDECSIYSLPFVKHITSIKNTSSIVWHPTLDIVIVCETDRHTSVWNTQNWSKQSTWKNNPTGYMTRFMDYQPDPQLFTLNFSNTLSEKTHICIHDIYKNTVKNFSLPFSHKGIILGCVHDMIQLSCKHRVAVFTSNKYLCIYNIQTLSIEKMQYLPNTNNVCNFSGQYFIGHYFDRNDAVHRESITAIKVDCFTDTLKYTLDVLPNNIYRLCKIGIHPELRCSIKCFLDRTSGVTLQIHCM